ncbi:hypothetical protein MNBD_PLANCTO03-924, partial [hydrothermal vent metagenome]
KGDVLVGDLGDRDFRDLHLGPADKVVEQVDRPLERLQPDGIFCRAHLACSKVQPKYTAAPASTAAPRTERITMPPPKPDAKALYAMAVKLFERGRYAESAAAAEMVLRAHPGHAETTLLRGSALARSGKPTEARRLFAGLLRADPAEHRCHHEISLTHLLEGNLAEAHEALGPALAAEPASPLYLAARAELFQAEGREAEARDLLAPLLGWGSADPRCCIVFAELCGATGRAAEGLEALAPVLESAATLTGPLERRALFARAALLDKAERHPEALDAATEANERAIELRGGPFDSAAHTQRIDALIAAWDRPTIAQSSRRSNPSDLPVFIVGMPRSGTSLVEQIIATHPSAHGCGELGLVTGFVAEVWPADGLPLPLALDPGLLGGSRVSRFASGVLGELRTRGGDATRITDKNPLNLLHLGVIASAFPNARIIHCRRDPLDTCTSCFFHDFVGDLRFTNRLDALGRFYRDADRLMAHWNTVLDLPILEVTYERLVAEQEAVSRGLIEFLGLPWDEACLRFHETERLARTASNQQVRKPMYASAVGRAARYGDRLDPLCAAFTAGAD